MPNEVQIRVPILSAEFLGRFEDSDVYNIIKDTFYRMIDELNNLTIQFNIYDELFQFSFRITKLDNNLRPPMVTPDRLSGLLVITSYDDFSHIIEEIRQSYIKISDNPSNIYENDALRNIANNISKRLYDFTLAVNISYPGFFAFSKGDICINRLYNSEIHGMNSDLLSSVFVTSLITKWPLIEILPIKQVWQWINEKTLYIDEKCTKPIDRALNALSYTFNTNRYEDLFYSLLGVEALYNTDKSAGIMEQIKQKTAMLLGEPIEYKKRIQQMYDQRSKIVHGKMNIPSKFFIFDASDEVSEFESKGFWNTIKTAQCILLATIQKLIMNNASELEFTYNLTYK